MIYAKKLAKLEIREKGEHHILTFTSHSHIRKLTLSSSEATGKKAKKKIRTIRTALKDIFFATTTTQREYVVMKKFLLNFKWLAMSCKVLEWKIFMHTPPVLLTTARAYQKYITLKNALAK